MNGEYTIVDGELKHYGVVGMKWGVRKNPAKAYAKSLKEKEYRTTVYERNKSKSDSERNAHRKTIDTRNKVERNIERTKERLANERKENADIAKTDLSPFDLKGRREYLKMLRESDDRVARQEKALTTQRVASSKLLEKAQTQNERAKELESYTEGSRKRLDYFTKVMDSTFKDLDPTIIAEGEAMYKTYKETRKWK